MKREHFDEIVRAIEANNKGRAFGYRLSLRNSEVYYGDLGYLEAAPDVITLTSGGKTMFIALTAIASVAEVRS